MYNRHLLLRTSSFVLAAALSAASAAVPLRFAVDAETPRTFQASAYRGETLDIEARLLWRGAPLAVADGADAAMCWQTNGMGDAWWTAPASVTTGGVVTATWSPSNDVGAASYRVFLRVAGPGGASYRANMLLRLLGSPGETPNALPLPVKVLDFARISYTNEPWSTSSSLSTNDVLALVDAFAGPTNRIMRTADDGSYQSNLEIGGGLYVADNIGTAGDVESLHLSGAGEGGYAELYGGRWEYRPERGMEGDREVAVMDDLPFTNLPPLSASATVGDLVDRINAVIGALHKEVPE